MDFDINSLKLSFPDILNFFSRYKMTILQSSLLFSILGGSYFLIKTPDYFSEASFREKSKSQVETSKSLSLAMIIGGVDKNENTAVSLMKSRTLLTQVITELGLQVKVSEEGFVKNLLFNIKSNGLAELSYWISGFYPDIPPRDSLDFRDVDFSGNVPLILTLNFTSDQEYTVRDAMNKELGTGSLGQRFISNKVSFNLLKNALPQDYTGTRWNIYLMPMEPTLEEVRRKMTVNTDTMDKSLIKLSFYYPHTELSAATLNLLMLKYVNYVKQEHIKLTDEQLSYLRRRQQEIAHDLKKIMEEYAQALADNVTSIESLAKLQESYTQRVLLIDLELKRLHKVLDVGVIHYDPYPNGFDSQAINRWLADLRTQKESADTLLAVLDQVPKPENSVEFQGIDVDTADKLVTEYHKILSDIEVSISHYQFIINQIQDPLIELSSLSSLLNDPASQKIIHKAIDLDLQKLDQANRSQKEIDRIKDDLALQRKYLLNHVDQEMQLLKIKQTRFYTKLKALQYAKLDHIHQRNTVLNQQIADYLQRRILDFHQEKTTLADQQKYIQAQMQKMPNKWASEKLMDLHLEMSGKMVEEITKLVETKNISSHIDTTQSTPLDKATPSTMPASPHILLLTLLGGLFGGLAALCFAAARGIYRQLPPSENLLKQIYLPVVGNLNPFNDSVIFRIMGWLNERRLEAQDSKIALLLLNRGTDYSHKLSECMSDQGLKIGLIAFEPKKTGNQTPVSNLSYKFQSRSSYDYLGIETTSDLQSLSLFTKPLQAFLEAQKNHYDWIFIASNLPPCSFEGANIMHYSDCALITIKNESIQDLMASMNDYPKIPISILL
jgi:hypothetical protein